jgi:hypothetical protein
MRNGLLGIQIFREQSTIAVVSPSFIAALRGGSLSIFLRAWRLLIGSFLGTRARRALQMRRRRRNRKGSALVRRQDGRILLCRTANGVLLCWPSNGTLRKCRMIGDVSKYAKKHNYYECLVLHGCFLSCKAAAEVVAVYISVRQGRVGNAHRLPRRQI